MSMHSAKVLNPQETDRALYMCSALGGKNTNLSQIMNNKGVIDAYYISEKKINLIKMNASLLGITNIYPHLFIRCYKN